MFVFIYEPTCVSVCVRAGMTQALMHPCLIQMWALDANFFVVILHQSLPLCYLTFFSLLPSFSLKRFGSIFFFSTATAFSQSA